MILAALPAILVAAGLAALALGGRHPSQARWLCLTALGIDLALAVGLWVGRPPGAILSPGVWWAEVRWSWIPNLGIGFHLAVDGLSLLMVVLTLFLGLLSVAASWTEIRHRVGFFHLNLMWILAGVLGVFLALDLFLFYFFWELMLVPMYFLIGVWGSENRIYAAIKFFLFTQASGLLMLLSILGLYFLGARATGVGSFDYADLLEAPVPGPAGMWLMLGFFIAFAVKLPAVPFHTWLPDAHTEAPTAGSVVLAGLLLKTGAYGLLRFAVPLFPEAAERFAPLAMALGAIGILYGAVLAFAQTDLKRLVAYTSVSHLGFVLLGVYAWNQLALQGVVLQMICHGLSTGGLFILVGILYQRTHTRDLRELGGLWGTVPRMGGVAMVLAMASLGLPGLGNFVAEFLTLVGAWRAHAPITAVAALGLVFATVYSLWIVQRTFHGEDDRRRDLPDLSAREIAVLGSMIVALLWLGLFPQAVLDTAESALAGLQGFFGP